MKQKVLKLYDKDRKQLLFFKNERNIKYWDNFWLKFWIQNRNYTHNITPNLLVCNITQKYLKPGNGSILEGGCGLGFNVFSLSSMKYIVCGIDNSERTVKLACKLYPNLKIEFADVQNIPYPDNFFAGYWSTGVIEHFFQGYSKIIDEMRRVIMPGGFLFLSFPYMSPFRILKSKYNFYKILNTEFYKDRNNINRFFYQFALNKELVINELENKSFKLRNFKTLGGIKGLKEEVFFLKFFIKRFLKLFYDIKNNKLLFLIRAILDIILLKFFGHSVLLIFQKK